MIVSTLDSGVTRHASSIYFSILLSVFAEHSLRTERIPDPSVTGSVIAPRPEEHANVSVTASGVVRPLSATEARPPPPSTKQGAGSSAANGNNFDIDFRGGPGTVLDPIPVPVPVPRHPYSPRDFVHTCNYWATAGECEKTRNTCTRRVMRRATLLRGTKQSIAYAM